MTAPWKLTDSKTFSRSPTYLRKQLEKYGLAINTKKTEVMFQPAPGNAYIAPNVSVE